MKRAILTFSLLLISICVSSAQGTQTQLTNDDIVKLLKSGLSAKIIVAKVKSTPGKYDTSTDALTRLKAANVPEEVLVAIIEAGNTAPTTSSDTQWWLLNLSSAQLGDLNELRTKSRVFIQADNENSRKAISGEISKLKSLTQVASANDADFVISYGNEKLNNVILSGEMFVLSKTSEPSRPVRIHWHAIKNQVKTPLAMGPARHPPEVNAARDLVKAFEKMKGGK